MSLPRVLRASACIGVKPLLASTRAARCCDGPRTLRASQKPMHQNGPARGAVEQPQRTDHDGRPGIAAAAGREASKWNHGCTRYYVANATRLACTANQTVIPAKAGTYAAWVPAFAGMTILCGVCYIMPCASVVPFACSPCRVSHPAPRAFSPRCAARPHAPVAMARAALPTVSPSVQRDDGETRHGPARPIIRLTSDSNMC